MTIKQIGGVFGRNPEFNDVEVKGALDLPDGVIASFGDNKDFQIIHDGSHTYLTDGGDGNVYFRTNSQFNITAANGAVGLQFNPGVNVSLRHNNVPVFTTTSEGVAVTGNVKMSNAGGGIDFSATSGTGTSELFDDYEEGTFTPFVYGTSSSGTATYTGQTGVYTKIGRAVHVKIGIGYTGHTGTGNLEIGNLPFYSQSSGPWSSLTLNSSDLSFPAGAVQVCGLVKSSNFVITLAAVFDGSTGSAIPMDAAAGIELCGTYFA